MRVLFSLETFKMQGAPVKNKLFSSLARKNVSSYPEAIHMKSIFNFFK